jgi:hypothetical protein
MNPSSEEEISNREKISTVARTRKHRLALEQIPAFVSSGTEQTVETTTEQTVETAEHPAASKVVPLESSQTEHTVESKVVPLESSQQLNTKSTKNNINDLCGPSEINSSIHNNEMTSSPRVKPRTLTEEKIIKRAQNQRTLFARLVLSQILL